MADFLSETIGKATAFVSDTVDDIKTDAGRAKLNNKIKREKKVVNKKLLEIGRYFYEEYKDNPPEGIADQIYSVKSIEQSIEIAKDDIKGINQKKAIKQYEKYRKNK